MRSEWTCKPSSFSTPFILNAPNEAVTTAPAVPAGVMAAPRSDHSATRLSTGDVLVADNDNLALAERAVETDALRFARYARDTVAQQAHALGPTVTEQMLASVQPGYVNDPSFDFGVHAKAIDLVAEVASQGEAQRQVLESTIATLMRNFGAHSRNMVRGILASTDTR